MWTILSVLLLFLNCLVTCVFVQFESCVKLKQPMFIKLKKKVQVWGNLRWSGDADFFYVLLTGAGSFHEVWRRSWDVRKIQAFFFLGTHCSRSHSSVCDHFFLYFTPQQFLHCFISPNRKSNETGAEGLVMILLSHYFSVDSRPFSLVWSVWFLYPAVSFWSCLGIVSFA